MDLTTHYLGLTLAHPLMPGASPLADDLDTVRRLEDAGAAAIVMYSLFEEQLVGEQLAIDQAIDAGQGTSEAMSYLPSPDNFRLGPDDYLEKLGKTKAAVDLPVIASLNGTTPAAWVRYARQIEQTGVDAMELNTYGLAAATETSSAAIEQRILDLVRLIKDATSIPLAVKLLPCYAGLPALTTRLVTAGAAGVVLFNRMYQPTIDLDELEMIPSHPLSHPGELAMRLRWIGMLSPHFTASIACSGGVHSVEGALRALMVGADVVQIVSALIRHGPDHLVVILRGIQQWLDEHEYDSLAQLRGSMNQLRCPDPRAYTRASYIQTLRVWD